MEYVIYVLKGFAMGLASSVPGLDGGTIAIVTKIYDRLIDSITLNFKKLFKNLPFLICVFFGIACGFFSASKLLVFLFTNYNVPTQFFFMGVIIGSSPNIYKECTKETKLKPVHIIPFVLGLSSILLMGIMTNSDASYSSSASMNPIFLFLISIVSAVGLIIPGFSGALIMKVLGAYDIAITAINEFDIVTILIIGMGIAIGILISTRILSFLMNKWRTVTYCVLGGMVLGSLPQIYPKEFTFGLSSIIPILLFIIGLALPLLSNHLGKNKE